MSFFSNQIVRLVTRRFWGLVFTLIIALAVLVQLGREAFPLLKDYSHEISERLSEQLGVKISIGEVEAEWEGMQPRLELFNVIIESLDGEDVFKIEKARAEINLVDSLLRRKLYWQRIEMENMHAKAFQDKNKSWHIRGLKTTPNSGRNLNIDDPLDIFLFGHRVEIKQLNLDITYQNGRKSHLFVPGVTLENDQSFHRIQANLQIDENIDAFKLIVEGRGDPRDADNFTANGYLELKKFPLEKVLVALGVNVGDEDNDKPWRDENHLDMSLWLQGSRESGISAKGVVQVDGFPIKLPDNFIGPSELKSEIFANWHYKDSWQITFKELSIFWPEFTASPVNAKIYQNNKKPVSLAVDQIDIAEWISYLDKVGLADTRAGKSLNELQPNGIVKNIDVKFLADKESKFNLQANLNNVTAEAFKGSPKLGSVNAYIQATANSGSVTIEKGESFELFFPHLYEESFKLEQARGRISWQIDLKNRITYVASSLLEAESRGESVKGKLYLALPFKRDDGEPWMTLALGMKKTAAKRYKQFLPLTVPDALERWLERSVGDGELSDIEFIYSGTTRKEGKLAKNIQLLADLSKGKIAFDETWPPLEGVNAHIYLDDKDLNVDVADANILGNHIAAAKITLEESSNKELELLIQGLIRSDAKAAMDLLQNSPVRNAIGKTFDTWEVEGNVNAELELTVPLTANSQAQKQNVSVNFSKAKLGITDLGLDINDVYGNLYYSTDKGLHTNNIKGKFWGKNVIASIASPSVAPGQRETIIKFNGAVDVARLREWTGRAELYFAAGTTPVEGKLVIPADKKSKKKLDIVLDTSLNGVSLELPLPVGKKKDVEKRFNAHIEVFEDHQAYSFLFDDWIRMNILRGESEINSAQILFGGRTLEYESGFLDIAGNIESFDLQEWNTARKRYFEYLDKDEKQGATLPLRFDLTVDKCTLGNFKVEDINVAGLGTKGDWTLYLDSNFLRGTLIAYDSDRPLFMLLEHVRFPANDKSENEDVESSGDVEKQEKIINTSVLAGLDLTQAVAVDFSTKEISFGEKNYGAWDFNLKPTALGIRLENIVAKVRGLNIGSEENPAEFVWNQINGKNNSSFVGQISSGNIGNSLTAWGQDKLMESRSAKMTLATNWPGAPDEVQLKSVEGLISLDVLDGNFVRGAKAGENPLLRLIALFNFDTLARRLKLDFSDLAKQGFAFDRVHGELDFSDGNINFRSPLVVESTSSRMQLTGSIDMINEQLDSDLIVTLPVASNLAVLTAFSAGLPAGVGVYLVSKLFKKQVDKVSSINYSVSGDWDAPKIKVRKVLKNSEPSDEFEE